MPDQFQTPEQAIDADALAADIEARNLIRTRLNRILLRMRDAPKLSASIVAAEYAARHGPDDRAQSIAAEILDRRFGRLRGLRRGRRRAV